MNTSELKPDWQRAKRLLSALLVVPFLVSLQACGPVKSEPMAETVKPVKLMTVPETFVARNYSFVAQVVASKRAELTFQVPGEIENLHVRMGQRVVEGELLADLDPVDYRLAVEAREAEFQLQRARLKRAKQLVADQLISADQMDQAQTAFTAAEASLAQAKTDLRHCRIIAPFTGVVSLTHAKAHQFVGAKQPVLSLMGRDYLDLAFNLPVPLFQRFPKEVFDQAKLEAEIDSFPGERLPLTFKEIATQPDADTNSYDVTLTMVRPERLNIFPGMSAKVFVNGLPVGEQSLVLPAGALASREGGAAKIWRFDAASGRLEALTIDIDDGNRVLSGIHPGDRIVVAGAADLTDGLKVRPWTREGGI